MEEVKRKRILAFLVDAFGLTFFAWLIGVLLSQHISISVVDFVVFFLLCKDCLNGSSLGKRIFKLQVLDSMTLKVASPLKCVFRNLCYTFWIVEFPYFLRRQDGKRIGDNLAGTKVVSGIIPCTNDNKREALVTLSIAILIFTSICVYISYIFR